VEEAERAKPKALVQKYSLDEKLFTRYPSSFLNPDDPNATYFYQRARLPKDKRISVCFGKVEPGKYVEWIHWYDELNSTIKGRGKITWRASPPFDRPPFNMKGEFEVGPGDIFVLSPGVYLKKENISKTEPWTYLSVAIPASDRWIEELL